MFNTFDKVFGDSVHLTFGVVQISMLTFPTESVKKYRVSELLLIQNTQYF